MCGIFPAQPASADSQFATGNLRCPGQRFEITVAPGGTSPYVALRAGQRIGSFLLDYGTTQSSAARDIFSGGTADKAEVDIDDFSLPTFSVGRFWLADYRLRQEPHGGQIGIVGTDFLSLLTADFSFDASGSDVILSALPCDHAALQARGLMPVRQDGFFSRDLRMVDVRMPNVPVLFIKVGGVFAVAQIDTGYDDRVFPPSIDINEALYDKLVSAGVALRHKGEVSIATCHGIVTNDFYEISQADVSLRTDDDRAIRSVAGAILIRKKSNGCGGIADMASPAAQLGMSIIASLRTIVFDTRAGLVWVPNHN